MPNGENYATCKQRIDDLATDALKKVKRIEKQVSGTKELELELEKVEKDLQLILNDVHKA